MSRLHRQHGLDSRRWKRLRRAILDAANWRCRTCGCYAKHVDHFEPLHQGGAPWDPANLQVLCAQCHRIKSRAEYGGPRDPAREAWAALVDELMIAGRNGQ